MGIKETPKSIEAERGVLGSILLEPHKIDKLNLKASDFYSRQHGILWDVLYKMRITNQVIDGITLREELVKQDLLNHVGGDDYLLGMMDDVVVASHSQHYEKIVKEKTNLRFEEGVFTKALGNVYNGESASDEVLSALMRQRVKVEPNVSISQLGHEWIDNCHRGNLGKFIWMLPEFETMLGKISSDIIILNAPRSSGKTALTLQWMCNAHKRKLQTPLLSLEMQRKELLPRLIAHTGDLNTWTMRTRGFCTENELTRSKEAVNKIKDLNLIIQDGVMDISQVRAWCFSERKKGADAIFIDNLLCISDGGHNYASRTAMYDNFMQQIVQLRSDIDIPLIILSHPNANLEVGYSKIIENLADIILLLMVVPPEGIDVNGQSIMKDHSLHCHCVITFKKNRQGLSPACSVDFIQNTQTFKFVNWIES
jgi:replicative DNA helicase